MQTNSTDDPNAVATVLDRRRVLALLGGVGLVALAGCGSDDDATAASSSTSSTAASSGTAAVASDDCSTIPEETAGPYPGDGSNGPDVLTADGVVRRDIRSSFGGASGTAEGVPLTIEVSLVDSTGSCKALPDAAVYLWHCDREGRYSLYSEGVTEENFLRGVQAADDAGHVSFQSVFPGAYSGRWPHIHFEVYKSVDDATGGGTRIATSQIALPEAACNTVYVTSGYEASVTNMRRTTLNNDNVFGDDDGIHQLGTVTGSVGSGMTVALTVPVDPSATSSGGTGGPPGR